LVFFLPNQLSQNAKARLPFSVALQEYTGLLVTDEWRRAPPTPTYFPYLPVFQ
jgi:hypothetical protein